jgi:hypothetical protein
MALWAWSDDPTRTKPEKAACAEALRFGGAVLPDGARFVGTCPEQGRQDIEHDASFRMPRAGVRDRPAHTYPDAPAPDTESCTGDTDLCLALDFTADPPSGTHPPADVVRTGVVFEDAGTALVRFSAFTL